MPLQGGGRKCLFLRGLHPRGPVERPTLRPRLPRWDRDPLKGQHLYGRPQQPVVKAVCSGEEGSPAPRSPSPAPTCQELREQWGLVLRFQLFPLGSRNSPR